MPALRTPRRAAPAALLAALLSLAAGCDRVQRQKDLDTPYARQFREAIPRVEKATGLAFKRPPAMAMRSSAQVREFVTAQLDEPDTQRELQAKEVVYKRLGGLPERTDLRALLLDLLEEQVAGYYDPERDTLYVVDRSDPAIAGGVITHELVHALQAQYVNVDSILHQKGDDDRLAAAQALLEGQATYDGVMAMSGGLINAATNWDSFRQEIRNARNSTPKMANAPLLLQESLIFPYLSGAELVRRFREQRAGTSPLDAMPLSTEQVLHGQAFFGTPPDAPTRVRLAGLAGITYENTIGEFETRVLLYEQIRELTTSTRAALGWDGDRIALVGDALVWASVWDTPVDAGEFFDAVSQAMALRYQTSAAGAAGATSRSFTAKGRTVTVTTGEVAGRPVVLMVDGPGGARPAATLANVQVEASPEQRRGGDAARR